MRRQIGPAATLAALAGLGFAFWTILALRTTVFAALDATSNSPALDTASGWGQVTQALSFVFYPAVDYGILAVVAVWAFRRRLRNLTWALALAIVLGWGSEVLIKQLVHRDRPPNQVPLITAGGYSYPSGHMVAITVTLLLITALASVTRRGPTAVWGLRIVGVGVWLLVAYNRWALRAHYVTDIVAGGLLGACVAAIALEAGGVRVRLPWAARVHLRRHSRVAVIVNPTKVPDWEVLRTHVDGAARTHGWSRPLWLETTPDDPGLAMTDAALRNGAHLILVAGGDGTVRTVCSRLSGRDVPLGILPAGTGNLLARNLGIPLDIEDALDVAFDGAATPLDLVMVSADSGEPTASVVMAGMGVDAIIMSETNPDLKRVVGPAAYVMAALAAASRPPFDVTVTLDGGEPFERRAGMALMANVGQLFGGIQLIPDALPHDGLLDLLVASPRRPADWMSMAGTVMTGLPDAAGLDRGQAARVVFETSEPVPYQVDGDTAGECRRLEASVVPGALLVMVPR